MIQEIYLSTPGPVIQTVDHRHQTLDLERTGDYGGVAGLYHPDSLTRTAIQTVDHRHQTLDVERKING